jgi:uncharacterized protein YrzB (UPF0473 family)
MIGDQNSLFITDEEGNEIQMEIVLTFENPDTNKQYVLFKEPGTNNDNVFAYEYDEEGNLNEIDDPAAFEMCEEILSAYEDEDSLNGKN